MSTTNDPDLGPIGPGHVCKHGIRWPHECEPCADAAWEAEKAKDKPTPATSPNAGEALTAYDKTMSESALALADALTERDKLRAEVERLTAANAEVSERRDHYMALMNAVGLKLGEVDAELSQCRSDLAAMVKADRDSFKAAAGRRIRRALAIQIRMGSHSWWAGVFDDLADGAGGQASLWAEQDGFCSAEQALAWALAEAEKFK